MVTNDAGRRRDRPFLPERYLKSAPESRSAWCGRRAYGVGAATRARRREFSVGELSSLRIYRDAA